MGYNFFINNFNSGEWSPLLDSRVDSDKYKGACRELTNMIPRTYGPACKRPGTQYMGAARASGSASRLVPFNFSTTTNFILEFSNLFVRFWTNRQQVITGTPYEVATPYNTAASFLIQYQQINDVMYITHPSFSPYKLSRLADDSWTLAAVTWDWPPFLDENVTDTTITASATTGTGITIYSSTSIFQSGHVGAYFQLAHRRAAKVGVSGSATGSFINYTFTANGSTSAILVLGSWSFTTGGTSANSDILIQRSYDGVTWETIRSFNIKFTRHVTATGDELKEAFLRVTAENWVAATEVWLEPSDSKVFGIVKITAIPSVSKTITGAANDGSGNIRITSNAHGFLNGMRVTISGVTGTTEANGTWTIEDVAANTFDLDASTFTNAYISGGTAVYASGTVATADVINELGATAATKYWSEGAFSTYQGFPKAVVLHEQRLYYGGTTRYPQTFWGSFIGDFDNFRRTSRDDAGIMFTIASKEANRIQWMVSHTKMAIGTTGEEWVVSGGDQDKAITPTNILVRMQSRYGSTCQQALAINDSILFLQRNNRKVREFVYSYEKDGWVSPDMTLLAEHITDGGITQMAFQQQPDSILWAIRSDGVLLGMTYEREQNVVAWHKHNTGVSAGDTFESVACIYGAADDDPDEVWFCVKRTINGATVRYIESFALTAQAYDFSSNDEQYYSDCHKKVTSASTTSWPGFSHLLGRVPAGVLGGLPNPKIYGAFAGFSGGTITTAIAGTQLIAGLAYVATVRPMKLELQLQDGTAQGRHQLVNRVVLRLFKSAGGKIMVVNSTTETKTFQINQAALTGGWNGQLLTQETPAFPVDCRHNASLDLYFESTDVTAWTLVAVILKGEVKGD